MHSLPIRVAPQPTESAGSLLLRSFSANGVTIRAIYAARGTPWTGEFLAQELAWLGEAANCSLEWLRWRTPLEVARQAKAWLGLQWHYPAPFSCAHPQVCPQCVHTSGHCRLEWELQFFCACPVHRRPLQRHCTHCGRPLTWGRPAIDVCRCRRLLASEREEHLISDAVVQWLTWTSECLGAEENRPALPPLWEFLPGRPTPGTVWAVIRAFGVRPSPTETFRARRATAQLSPLQLCQLVQRAHDRLSRMTSGGAAEGEIDTGSLRRYAARAHSSSELDVVDHCLRASRRLPNRRFQEADTHQLGLFE